MMERINGRYMKDLLNYVADAVIASKDYLTELDSKIGDGDHGLGMERGMLSAKEALASMSDHENIYLYFSAVGQAMLMKMGGASGVIFSSMFSGEKKNHAPAQELTPPAFAQAMVAGLAAVKMRGKASVGDKTMVDALEPACNAMLANCSGSFETMLREAAEAAKEGAASTAEYQAKFGRAKSLMERAKGHMDSGAVSTAIMFRAMSSYVTNHPVL